MLLQTDGERLRSHFWMDILGSRYETPRPPPLTLHIRWDSLIPYVESGGRWLTERRKQSVTANVSNTHRHFNTRTII